MWVLLFVLFPDDILFHLHNLVMSEKQEGSSSSPVNMWAVLLVTSLFFSFFLIFNDFFWAVTTACQFKVKLVNQAPVNRSNPRTVLYHDQSGNRDLGGGGDGEGVCVCGVGLDTLTACLLVCYYIRQPGRESGSSNRAIRTPRDPIDLLIDPLLPQLVQTTVRVYTATTGKQDMQHRRRGMGRAEGETLRVGKKTEKLTKSLASFKCYFHSTSILCALPPSLLIAQFKHHFFFTPLQHMWFWFVVAFIFPIISEWECSACCLGEWSDDMKMLEASPQWEIKALGLWKPGARPGVFVLPTDGSHYVSCDLEILETPWDTPERPQHSKLFVLDGLF